MKFLNDSVLTILGLSPAQLALLCLSLVFITLIYILFAITDMPKEKLYKNYIDNEVIDFPRVEKLNLYRVTFIDGETREMIAISLLELDKKLAKPYTRIELLA